MTFVNARIVVTILSIFCAIFPCDAFTIVSPSISSKVSSSTTQLYGWGDAFKNDASLGKAENPGLKNGPKFNEQVTVNGKPVPGAVVGQKLTVVAGKVRVKIPVNCQKGDCGTCMVNLNGRKVKGMYAFHFYCCVSRWGYKRKSTTAFRWTYEQNYLLFYQIRVIF